MNINKTPFRKPTGDLVKTMKVVDARTDRVEPAVYQLFRKARTQKIDALIKVQGNPFLGATRRID